MNVVFHIAVGAGIVASISHLKGTQINYGKVAAGFILGLISHGVLDYAPHCCPINSQLDLLIGLIFIITSIFYVKKEWRMIVIAVYLGCVFPDIIDLSPGIISSQLGLKLPTFENIFPWHVHEYSGSIYSGECKVSNVNHMLTLVFCGIAILMNYGKIKEILK